MDGFSYTQTDPDFDAVVFDRQMSVMRGQVRRSHERTGHERTGKTIT